MSLADQMYAANGLPALEMTHGEPVVYHFRQGGSVTFPNAVRSDVLEKSTDQGQFHRVNTSRVAYAFRMDVDPRIAGADLGDWIEALGQRWNWAATRGRTEAVIEIEFVRASIREPGNRVGGL